MQKLYRVYRYALFLLDRFKYLVAAALDWPVVHCQSTKVLLSPWSASTKFLTSMNSIFRPQLNLEL